MTEISVSEQPMSTEDLALVSKEFETAPASTVIRWAAGEFGDSLVLAASFEDIVLIDLATKVAPDIEVVFLDTEAHFPETLAFVEEVRARYDLNLTSRSRDRRRRLPLWQRAVLPVPEGRAPEEGRGGQGGLVDVAEALRRPHACRHAHRQLGCLLRSGQGQPAGDVDRRRRCVVSRRSRPAGAPTRGRRATGPSGAPRRPVRWPKGRTRRAGRWSGLDKTECGLHV